LESEHHKSTSRCDNNTSIGPNMLLYNEDEFLPDIRQEGAGLELCQVACYFIEIIAIPCSSIEQL